MSKSTKKNTEKLTEQTDVNTVGAAPQEQERRRPRRKKAYEATRTTQIPEEVSSKFLEDEWKIRFLRYSVAGKPDLPYLAKCHRDGWEFVTKEELVKLGLEWYLSYFQIEDERHFKGLLVSGDLVLAKADTELVDSINGHYESKAKRELNAADTANMTKRHQFVDVGSKSTVSMSEPRFQN